MQISGGKKLFCRHCGEKIEDDSRFCRYCGGNVYTGKEKKEQVKDKVPENVSVNGVKVSADDAEEEEVPFMETPVDAYRKVKLTPVMRRKIEDQKKEAAKKEAINNKLRKAIVKNVMARKKEAEINKTGNTHIDMYKRHLKDKK
ncbi:MAG TPA: zinc ribbon domain-containing protein, partial [Firmicutes bacterium]|nr:zinc ribbon domain-containing protein [Bacillota bacterium]